MLCFTSCLLLEVHVWTCRPPSSRKLFRPESSLVSYFHPTYFTLLLVGEHYPRLVLQRVRQFGWLLRGRVDRCKEYLLLNTSPSSYAYAKTNSINNKLSSSSSLPEEVQELLSCRTTSRIWLNSCLYKSIAMHTWLFARTDTMLNSMKYLSWNIIFRLCTHFRAAAIALVFLLADSNLALFHIR